jgi:hypothetical protein
VSQLEAEHVEQPAQLLGGGIAVGLDVHRDA